MPQIFDVATNENARYKRNELELMLGDPWIVTYTNKTISYSSNNKISFLTVEEKHDLNNDFYVFLQTLLIALD